MPADKLLSSYPESAPIKPELQKLGLSVEDFTDVSLSAYRAYSDASPLNPVTYPGTAAWAAVVVALRASLSRYDWAAEDVNNQPQVVSSSHNIVITVSSGNEKTGVPYSTPQTRGIKGTQTVLGISSNIQFDMFESEKIHEVNALLEKGAGRKQYWMFLFYIDLIAKEVRSELSRPIQQGPNGKVIGWSERIILPALSFKLTEQENMDSISFSGDGAYEVNIPITSKDDE